jgi:hypothetical protein
MMEEFLLSLGTHTTILSYQVALLTQWFIIMMWELVTSTQVTSETISIIWVPLNRVWYVAIKHIDKKSADWNGVQMDNNLLVVEMITYCASGMLITESEANTPQIISLITLLVLKISIHRDTVSQIIKQLWKPYLGVLGRKISSHQVEDQEISV